MLLDIDGWESDNDSYNDVVLIAVEKKLGVKLPASYIDLMKVWNGCYFEDEYQVPIENDVPQELSYYLGDGFWALSSIAGLSLDESNDSGILYTSSSASEWGVPNGVIAFCGDGHTWLALDYRNEKLDEPSVIFIESDDLNSFVISNNFIDFLKKLIPSDQVYDYDGNIIYQK
ncbi:SMI1/KNR4 family protein [Vibrio caribbeanicus]|uniref:SMI1/KNR4 family protein n=1 Tax=Vibrio caribbeanicus TaxID=701175 RepID=UPI0022849D67|nr:SMI1/KNR4 family protein [Vibrio caribbeanicus]MCY9846365.1 SMI1/KNR4 family protein [Vibrio caribbeanicus]